METETTTKERTSLKERFLRMPAAWRVTIWLILITGVAVIGYLTILFAGDACRRIGWGDYEVYVRMSNGYELRTYDRGPDCVAQKGSHHITLKDVDWVRGLLSKDDIWVVSKNGLVGFFDTRTGSMTTPFCYKMAWNYSEGKAAVIDSNSRLYFINLNGNLAIDKYFPFNGEWKYKYQFHHGMCPIMDSTGRTGLIDLSGDWLVEPFFDSAAYNDGFWWLTLADSLMVIDSTGRTIIDLVRGKELRVHVDNKLEVWHEMYPGQLYNTSGHLLASQTFQSIERLFDYETQFEEETNVMAYFTDYERCGLLSKDGEVLTEARFSKIEMIDKHLFQAKYDCYSDEPTNIIVLINDKGELVERESK